MKPNILSRTWRAVFPPPRDAPRKYQKEKPVFENLGKMEEVFEEKVKSMWPLSHNQPAAEPAPKEESTVSEDQKVEYDAAKASTPAAPYAPELSNLPPLSFKTVGGAVIPTQPSVPLDYKAIVAEVDAAPQPTPAADKAGPLKASPIVVITDVLEVLDETMKVLAKLGLTVEGINVFPIADLILTTVLGQLQKSTKDGVAVKLTPWQPQPAPKQS